jgi:hypothetical protein
VASSKTDPPAVLQDRFREYAVTQDKPYEVDEDNGIIKNVLVLGTASRGTGVYTRPVMEDAIQRYDGQPTFVNHTRDGSHPSYDNKLGVHRNPHMSPEGIRTDFHFNPKHRCASQLLWDAKNDPKNVGFSHDADCEYRVEGGKRVVTSIAKVYSVDLVTRPGTTGGMFEEELLDPETEKLAVGTLAGLDHARTILYAPGIAPADKRERLMEAAVQLHTELLEYGTADEVRADEGRKLRRRFSESAQNSICRAMWDDEAYPSLADKETRIQAVLADWKKELQALPGVTGGASFKEEAVMAVDYKEVKLDDLTRERPELVAQIKGTDEKSRMTEEATALKATLATRDAELAELRGKEAARMKESEIAAELKTAEFPIADEVVFSKRFQEQLAAAPDKAARADLIHDRLELAKGRVQEQAVIPPPMTDMRPAAAGGAPDRSYDNVFGGK